MRKDGEADEPEEAGRERETMFSTKDWWDQICIVERPLHECGAWAGVVGRPTSSNHFDSKLLRASIEAVTVGGREGTDLGAT